MRDDAVHLHVERALKGEAAQHAASDLSLSLPVAIKPTVPSWGAQF